MRSLSDRDGASEVKDPKGRTWPASLISLRPPPTRLHNEKPFLIAMRKGGDCTARQAANFISILPLLLLLNSSMPFSSSKPANLLTGANREALHFSTPKNPPLSLPPIRRAGGGGGRFHTRQIGRLFQVPRKSKVMRCCSTVKVRTGHLRIPLNVRIS